MGMESWIQDLRHAARVLVRRPGFSSVAVATLALAIGANAAIFSVVHAVLLRPLPFADPDRLVWVWEKSPQRNIPRQSVTPVAYAAYRDRSDAFTDLGASSDWLISLTGAGESESIIGYRFSGNFFSILGVPARLGRTLGPQDARPGHDHVVVLADSLWRRRFGADPGVIGRAITLDDESYTVVGVMPPGFVHPARTEMWAPLVLEGTPATNARSRFIRMIGRLKPGLKVEQASPAVAGVAAALASADPANQGGWSADASPIASRYTGDIKPALLVLLGAVGFVLLIAAANVSNLLLARAADRGREVAIRASLGAGRARLVRQFLVESVLLAAIGGVCGVALAFWGVDLLKGLFPSTIANLAIPRMDQIDVDAPVLAFALVLSLVTGIAFGLAPALHASRAALGEALRESGRSTTEGRAHRRFRGALVVSEVALALVLTTGAALMIRSFAHLQGGNLGFDPAGVTTARVLLPARRSAAGAPAAAEPRYGPPEKKRAFFAHVLARLRETPGVEAAGATTFLPLSGWSGGQNFEIEGRPPVAPVDAPEAMPQSANEDYFRAMRIPVLSGRGIAVTDVATAPPVVVINQTMARRYWAGEDPVGRRIGWRVGGPQNPITWRQVVGVVGDVRHDGLAEEAQPEIYLPYAQSPSALICLTVRTSGRQPVAQAIQQAVWSFDKDQPVLAVMPLEQLAAESITMRKVSTLLLGFFAAVAVFLAALGLYGVMAHAVARRTHEIGIRMAIGANAADVLAMIVGRGVRLAALGAALGLAASLGLTRLLASLLYGVSPTDPASFAAVAVFLIAVAALASYIPARRAARVDPAEALRYE
jgi:putative ABC transport system permease protein